LQGEPQPGHHVYFPIPADNTIMDLTGDFPQGRKVCSMTVTAGGSVTFLAGYTGDPDDKRGLHLEDDMTIPDDANEYAVILGPWDRILVGAPAEVGSEIPTGHGETYGFQWRLEGVQIDGFNPAVVIVSDTIGCGHWEAAIADIVAGFKYGSIQDGRYDEVDVDALGVIDGSVCGVYPFPDSAWVLDGVLLRAQQAYNLQYWHVTETLNRPNDFELTEYFQSGDLLFSGTQGSTFRVAFADLPGNPPEQGLRIVGSMSIEGPLYDPQHPELEMVQGPSATVHKLAVDDRDGSGALSLSDGVQFRVGVWSETQSRETLPVEAVFEPTSSLRYGPRMGQPPSQALTLFEVFDRTSDPPREPTLEFLGNPVDGASYITTAKKRETGLNQELELRLGVHLDVQGDLSKPSQILRDPSDPGQGYIAWDGGDVDLVVTQAVNSPGQDCRSTNDCHDAEIEAIAGDSCNVWFQDAPEPRCLKHWRSFTLNPGSENYARLVDRRDNYVATPGPCAQTPAEAMYVKGDVFVNDEPELDVNGLRLYYGGTFTDLVGPASLNGVIKLIKTEWGDFNGDCYIDDMDAAILPDGALFTVPFPNLDWDGDCDVDGVELGAFDQRYIPGSRRAIQVCLDQRNEENGGQPIPLNCPSPAPFNPAGCPVVTAMTVTGSGSMPDCKIDARQNNSPEGTECPVQEGLGSAEEPIRVKLMAGGLPVTNAADLTCWDLNDTRFCASGTQPSRSTCVVDEPLPDPPGDELPNQIASVSLTDCDGEYEIQTRKPIWPGYWTTIHYRIGDPPGTSEQLSFGFMPGDVTGDGATSPFDLLRLIDCLNNMVYPNPSFPHPCEDWRLDIDRSGVVYSGQEIPRMVDLLDGAGVLEPWNNQYLKTCDNDPPPCTGSATRSACQDCTEMLALLDEWDEGMEEEFQFAIAMVQASCNIAPQVEKAGSRYLAVSPPPGSEKVALWVTGDCVKTQVACVGAYVKGDGTLISTPVFQFPSQWGAPDTPRTVFVGDDAIIPNTRYHAHVQFEDSRLSGPTAGSTGLWGDADQSGVVDGDDITCVIYAYGGLFYDNCTLRSADLMPCEPDRLVDMDDLSAVIAAFGGEPFPCPPPCTPPDPPGGGESGMEGLVAEGDADGAGAAGGTDGVIVASEGKIQLAGTIGAAPEDAASALVTMDVFLSGVEGLHAYQVALDAMAADGSPLAIESVAVDTARADYVFAGREAYEAVDTVGGRLAAVLRTGEVTVGEGLYLGRFTFRKTSDVTGPIALALHETTTRLRDAAGRAIVVETQEQTVLTAD
jgi:hypothetical protein